MCFCSIIKRWWSLTSLSGWLDHQFQQTIYPSLFSNMVLAENSPWKIPDVSSKPSIYFGDFPARHVIPSKSLWNPIPRPKNSWWSSKKKETMNSQFITMVKWGWSKIYNGNIYYIYNIYVYSWTNLNRVWTSLDRVWNRCIWDIFIHKFQLFWMLFLDGYWMGLVPWLPPDTPAEPFRLERLGPALPAVRVAGVSPKLSPWVWW